MKTRSLRRATCLSTSQGIATITLTAPVDLVAAQALCDAAADIEHDDTIRVVLITATGRDFCLGTTEPLPRRVDWIEAIARLTRPVIAAIQGNALAEGFELALACDMRVAASNARFALPQLARGQLPSNGGTQRLPRLIGSARALDLLLSGRTVAAAEAEAIGLVSRVVPPRRLRSAAHELAGALATRAPIALRYAKEAVWKGVDMTLDQGIRLEEDLYVLLQTTADRREGIDAFLSKRGPRFRGK